MDLVSARRARSAGARTLADVISVCGSTRRADGYLRYRATARDAFIALGRAPLPQRRRSPEETYIVTSVARTVWSSRKRRPVDGAAPGRLARTDSQSDRHDRH